jgi:Cyclin, N-terminal domain
LTSTEISTVTSELAQQQPALTSKQLMVTQRIESFDLAEDILHVMRHFKLPLSTLFLALSILKRVLYSIEDRFIFESMKEILSFNDQRKLLAYMSLSVASKYDEHVAFKFSDLLPQMKFDAPTEILEVILTPQNLRGLEGDLLRKLNFKIGDASEPSHMQYSRVHDKLMSAIPGVFTET